MRSKFAAFLSLLLTLPLYTARAGSISVDQIVVFGDSLSDNGNAAIALGGALPGNYAPNAFTDGPNTSPATTGPFGLWIDQFATLAGLPDPQPYLSDPGVNNGLNTNFAVASAQTGTANPQDIGNQVATFSAINGGVAPANALYVIWGGANDILDGTNSGVTAANNLESDIETLIGEGAKDFLWLNLPPLGDTPLGTALGPLAAAELNAQSTDFDNQWAADITALDSAGADVIGVDVNAEFDAILTNPAQFGFTNVTSPAQGTSANPNDYLFWDSEHPTTAADALIAQVAYSDFIVPEPRTITMLLSGLAAILFFSRFRF